MVYKKYNKSKGKAEQALTKVKKLERKFKPEIKQKLAGQAPTALSNAWWMATTMSAIAEGTDFEQRIGSKITVKRLRARIYLTANASAGTTPQMCRIIMVKANQQISDLAPASGFIVPTNLGTYIDYNSSEYRSIVGGSVTVLFDKRYIVDLVRAPSKLVDIDIKVNIPVLFNGTADTDVQKNGVFLYMVSDIATNPPAVEAVYLTDYTDI